MKMNKKTLCVILLLISIPFISRGQSVTEIVNKIQNGNFEEAKKILLNINRTEKENPTILFLEGLLTIDGIKASNTYNTLLQKYPHSKYIDDAAFRIALMQYSQGLYNTANKNFKKIILSTSQKSIKQKCQYWIGLSFLALDKPDSAAFRFNKSIDNFTKNEITKLAKNSLGVLNLNSYSDKDKTQLINSAVYAVQVGAFSIQQNAILLKAFYENHGYRVELGSKSKNNNKFYLVWVGPYNSIDKARYIGKQLNRKFDVTYTLVTLKK